MIINKESPEMWYREVNWKNLGDGKKEPLIN